MVIAFFAGSFNPLTTGHRDIIERALTMFDRVIVGIGVNSDKQTNGNIEAIRAALPDIEVIEYKGLTAVAAKECGATVLLRSIRNTQDLAYEQPIAEANRREFGIDTVFLLARPELAHISSSLVRELQRYGHDVHHLLG